MNVLGEDFLEKMGRKIGIIAGSGNYPIVLAEKLHRKRCEVYGIAIRGQTNPILEGYCDKYFEVGLGQFGKAIRILKENNVSVVTMAGGINKRLLFERGFLWKHWPDLYTLRLFAGYFLSSKKKRNNDSLLLTCVDAFEKQNITVASATDLIPELIVKKDILTKRKPTTTEWKDVQCGWKIAREMSGLDIGQCIAVKGQSVIAVEALEGTDSCIRRAGSLCSVGDFVVVKIAKPNQDMRFDVPFFGMNTIRSVVESGCSVLVMEADKTIFINQQEVIDFADKNNICVLIVSDEDVAKDEVFGGDVGTFLGSAS